MTKRKYLRQLRKALKGVSAREKDKITEYYGEMIDEAYERGKTTREVFADLDTPEEVAREYFNANEGAMGGFYDNDGRYTEPRPMPACPPRGGYQGSGLAEPCEEGYVKEKKRKNPLFVILMIPVWIVAFVLALALAIVGVSLVVSCAVCVFAFFVGGLYAIVMSFGIIASHGAIAAAQIGAGIVLIGLSLLCALLVKPVAKLFCGFAGWIFRGFRRSSKERVAVSHGKQVIATVAVALVFVIAGSATGVIGFGKLDWQWRNLAVMGEREERTQTVSLEGLTALTVNSDNLSLIVVPTTESDAKLVYEDFSDYMKEYSYENGVVTLRSFGTEARGHWFFAELKSSWERGLLFPAVASLGSATLYVPEDYTGSLDIKLNNGYLNLSELSLGAVTLETDNGAVLVKNASFDALTVDTDNGAVKLENIDAKSISAQTDNGAIKLVQIIGETLSFKVGNGAITGSVMGNEIDFRITASTGLGSCNLKNSLEGDKTLTVRTGCGAIKISFMAE